MNKFTIANFHNMDKATNTWYLKRFGTVRPQCRWPGTSTGFTLIELLIVMALLGVLATVILTALNPLEQINRASDSARKSGVSLLAKAIVAYANENNGQYPPSNTWMTDLIANKSIIDKEPERIGSPSTNCTTANPSNRRNYCYRVGGNQSIVFSRLTARNALSACAVGNGPVAFFVWRSDTGVTRIECPVSGEPVL